MLPNISTKNYGNFLTKDMLDEEDDEVEDNDKYDDNNKDDNNDKGISALGLDRDLGFLRG